MNKKYAGRIAIVLFVFFMLSNPTGTAKAVQGAFSGLQTAGGQIGTFAGELGK